jgi:uncharacterized protein
MRFEWDARKAQLNSLKHKISFDLAITAFDDPYALIAPDERHTSASEIRQWLIGESDLGVLVVVFTVRDGGQTHRIISARRASKREKKRYEQIKGISI